MAKKSSIEKAKKKERLVNLKWEKRQELKKIISDPRTSEEKRADAVKRLNKMPKNSSRVRIRNRCQITGRCRGYLRKFKLSRICFRDMSSKGLIPGITKSSW